MASKRTKFVHAKNPDTQEFEVFGPDDKLPSWASKALKESGMDATEEPKAAPATAQTDGEGGLL